MKPRTFVESFNSAIEGFIYVLKTQRNMKFHFLAGVVLFILGIYLNFNNFELTILALAVGLVLFAEMVNTAIEHTIDLINGTFHPLARIVKDISAGAVLISAACAVVVGYLLFINRIQYQIETGIIRIQRSPWHITFIILIIILSIVILSKVLLHRGTPLRGGMPSGHSAFVFSIWAIISFFYPNGLLVALVFVLAFMVARARFKSKVHSFSEVFLGAVLGVLVTTLVFQLLARQ